MKKLPAGTHRLVTNNGQVLFQDTTSDRMHRFSQGWAADGIRKVIQLPKVGETVTIERDVQVTNSTTALANA